MKDVIKPPMRRFYKTVSLESDLDGNLVLLDGRRLRSPGKAVLRTKSKGLAAAIAEEWDAQEETVLPMSMPMTQLAFTAVDRVHSNREEIETSIAGYIDSDLVSFRVEDPADLAERQADVWQPYVEWFSGEFDVNVPVTTSLLAGSGAQGAAETVRGRLKPMDDAELAAMSVMTQAMGSVVLSFAVFLGFADPNDAALASQLEETYQRELWGEDREDLARRQSLIADVIASAKFLTLHRSE